MSDLSCKHCGREIKETDSTCESCGIPLPPNHATQRQRKFLIWFGIVVVFCIFMMFWLPPDWSPFVER
ncbi:MAG: zinc-ribbon domain-containing protein [Pseudomonadales bacterium]|nr:zinc-ribbon domain-containing protein [Pseudomonadales bacterium]